MLKPDQRQFEADLLSAAFRNGMLKGCWDIESTLDLAWPTVVLWIGAAARSSAPDRFYLALDCTGYRADPPTGTFWDPATRARLADDKRPRGKPNSRFSKVFRTDWEKGRALYHPYDRVAAQSHPEWVGAQPHLVWNRDRTIVDCLEEYMLCYGRRIILAFSDPLQQIGMPRLLWARLIASLRRAGQGTRESGAFVLGYQEGSVGKATRFVCYDTLDPKAYQGGAIQFHSEGYAALWRMCRETNVQLLCDVHTHPGQNVGQSHIDQRHPMVAVVGHTALILPRFAHTSRWSLRGVGVYEYLGGFQWRTHELQSPRSRLFLTWW